MLSLSVYSLKRFAFPERVCGGKFPVWESCCWFCRGNVDECNPLSGNAMNLGEIKASGRQLDITLKLQTMILFDLINIQSSAHKDDELFLQEAKEKGEMPPGIMYKSPLPPRRPGKGSRSRSARGEKKRLVQSLHFFALILEALHQSVARSETSAKPMSG